MVRDLCVSLFRLYICINFWIAIRVLLGSSVGLPAASLCINRRLYQIATMTNRRTGHVEVRSISNHLNVPTDISFLEITGNLD